MQYNDSSTEQQLLWENKVDVFKKHSLSSRAVLKCRLCYRNCSIFVVCKVPFETLWIDKENLIIVLGYIYMNTGILNFEFFEIFKPIEENPKVKYFCLKHVYCIYSILDTLFL